MGRIEDRDKHLETLKGKHLQETEKMAQSQRFGLFSQPPCLGIGDNKFQKPLHPRREDGRPATLERNVFQGPARSGKGKSGFFKEMSYVSIGQQYIEQDKLHRQEAILRKSIIPGDQAPFKDQNKWLQKTNLDYPYIEQQENKKGKCILDLDGMGKPRTEEPNVKVSLNTDNLFKFRTQMKDEYSRQRELQTAERLSHYKAMGELPNFRTWDNVKKPFVAHKITFGEVQMPKHKVYSYTPKNIQPHDAPFRYPNPAKKGHNKTINKFPEYKDDPIRIVKRKPPQDAALKKDPFKLTNPHDKSKPCTSISGNKTNLRRVMTMSGRCKY